MKILCLLMSFLIAAPAFASGRLSLQGSIYSETEDQIHPMMGLSIDEQVAGPLYFNSWIGMGSRPVRGESKDWGSAKASMEIRFSRLAFGGGGFLNHAFSSPDDKSDSAFFNSSDESGIFAKVSYKLW